MNQFFCIFILSLLIPCFGFTFNSLSLRYFKIQSTLVISKEEQYVGYSSNRARDRKKTLALKAGENNDDKQENAPKPNRGPNYGDVDGGSPNARLSNRFGSSKNPNDSWKRNIQRRLQSSNSAEDEDEGEEKNKDNQVNDDDSDGEYDRDELNEVLESLILSEPFEDPLDRKEFEKQKEKFAGISQIFTFLSPDEGEPQDKNSEIEDEAQLIQQIKSDPRGFVEFLKKSIQLKIYNRVQYADYILRRAEERGIDVDDADLSDCAPKLQDKFLLNLYHDLCEVRLDRFDLDKLFERVVEEVERKINRLPRSQRPDYLQIQSAMKNFSRHSRDTGSAEAQIAVTHTRIQILTKHLLKNKHDFACKRGLEGLVTLRRKMLNYLSRSNPVKAAMMAKELGIRWRKPLNYVTREEKYQNFKNTRQKPRKVFNQAAEDQKAYFTAQYLQQMEREEVERKAKARAEKKQQRANDRAERIAKGEVVEDDSDDDYSDDEESI